MERREKRCLKAKGLKEEGCFEMASYRANSGVLLTPKRWGQMFLGHLASLCSMFHVCTIFS